MLSDFASHSAEERSGPSPTISSLAGISLATPGKNADDILNSFDWAEVRQMNQDGFARFGILRTNDFAGFGIAQVDVAIDEVGDDVDRAGGRKGFDGLASQIVGDGGDAVTLVNGVAGDRQIGAVGADQGDVCPVQRGDKGKPAAASGEHLTGQQSR